MLAIGIGSNGQWVRIDDPEGARAFLYERRKESDLLDEHRRHELQVIGRLWDRIRRLFRRGR